MDRIEASVVMCKCSKHHRLFGVRFEKMAGEWKYNWAFEIKESVARNEGYDRSSIKGNISPTDDYPGCPYCGSMGFVICSCGKLSCLQPNVERFTCEWCGYDGTLRDYDGSGFESYGDR